MNDQKMWIWEHQDYPLFAYDKNEIEAIIFEASKAQGALEGILKHLTNQENDAIRLESMIDEIMTTSKIEGEILQRSSVRSSLRKQTEKIDDHLSSKHTDNLVKIQDDANSYDQPLSIEKLHEWHYNLLIEGVYDTAQVTPGAFRDYDDMYVLSGEGIRTRAHYKAPPKAEIKPLMDRYIDYCNNTHDNPLIKSAIAHIWFEQIHPYGDGNGRIGRNITNHILSKELGLDTRYFSLSHSILKNKEDYYKTLEQTNRLSTNPTLDFTEWIKKHTHFIIQALHTTIETVDKVIAKTKLYDAIKGIKINDNQAKIVDMLIEGKIDLATNALYRSLTDTNSVTASRHLKDLVKKGILKQAGEGQGRSTSYVLNRLLYEK